jgi:FMN-dependent NADH-azoreductase
MAMNILRVDGSMRQEGSVTRQLADKLMDRLTTEHEATVNLRDLAVDAPGFVDQDWINANFTATEERSVAQREKLAVSDALVAEVQAADVLVIASPIYNFSVPAALKAWIDMIARARLTFKYTETGPVGLLENKKAYVVMASGGTEIGGPIDYARDYLRHVLGFIGITDVTFIEAGQVMANGDAAIEGAFSQIDALAA